MNTKKGDEDKERECALNYIETTRCHAKSFKSKDQTQTNIKKSTIIFVPDGENRRMNLQISTGHCYYSLSSSRVLNTRTADFTWSAECVCEAQ